MARTKENLKAAAAKVLSEPLGVSADRLRRWAARGFIKATITADGHYRYDLEEYLEAVEEAARRAK
jgi:predicted site-specific integrase-resolvase